MVRKSVYSMILNLVHLSWLLAHDSTCYGHIHCGYEVHDSKSHRITHWQCKEFSLYGNVHKITCTPPRIAPCSTIKPLVETWTVSRVMFCLCELQIFIAHLLPSPCRNTSTHSEFLLDYSISFFILWVLVVTWHALGKQLVSKSEADKDRHLSVEDHA